MKSPVHRLAEKPGQRDGVDEMVTAESAKKAGRNRPASGYPCRRIRTRHRGISYRPRADGSRAYTVFFKGRYLGVEGGEQEALAKQAELRGKSARGEKVVATSRVTFCEVAEQWLESKRHLRPWTRKNYRAALDLVLLPRFGRMRLTAISAEHVAS